MFTFHNGLLHALGPERCVDPCCPSHDPNVPVILLGDNGTARRSNIFTGSMSYYSRRLAKILAQLDEGEVSFRKVYYGWINGEDNVADYYSRHDFWKPGEWRDLGFCETGDMCPEACWL